MSKESTVFLQRIKIRNWAQYEDLELEFPVPQKLDEEMPIIFFIGRNGAGKTRLFQAIRLVLFGETDSAFEGTKDFFEFFPLKKKEQFIKKLLKGEHIPNQSILISLTFKEITTEGIICLHKFTKTFLFSNFFLRQKEGKINLQYKEMETSIKYHYREPPNTWAEKTENEFKSKINLWFPIETRDFYFFDGEKLNELMVKNQDKKVKFINDIILRKSDHYKITQILNTTKTLQEQFQQKANKIKRKNDLVRQSQQSIKAVEEDIKNIQRQIKSTEDLIYKLKKQQEEIENKLKELELSKEKVEQIKENKTKIQQFQEINQKLQIEYTKLTNSLGDNSRKIYDFEWILIWDVLNEVLKDLEDKYQKNIIPSKLNKSMYDVILARKRCICSKTELTEEQERNIRAERELAIDERLNDEARRFLELLKSKREAIPEKIQQIIKHREECIKHIKRLQELGDKPSVDENQEEKFIQFMSLVQEKTDILPKLSAAEESLKNLKEELEGMELVKQEELDLLVRRKAAEGRIEDADLWEYVTRKTNKTLENCRNKLKEQIIQYIKDQTGTTFLALIEPKEEYAGVYIDDNWNFGYYMKDCPNIPIVGENGPSKGQYHILGLSFLHSISGTTSCKIPIFFDTPLGRIDEIHKANIGKNLPYMFEGTQVILFLTGSEAKDMIEFISGRHGYLIKNENNYQAKCEPIETTEYDIEQTLERIEKENIQWEQQIKETKIIVEGD